MVEIVLFKPDIPQNTAAIIRFCACLKINVHIIEPCGFNMDDPRFKKVVMDYLKLTKITRYLDFDDFSKKNFKARIILLTTKAKNSYHRFEFKKKDFLLMGRESAGVPLEMHKRIKEKIKVPLNKKARSLNVAITVAIVASEALRQQNFFK